MTCGRKIGQFDCCSVVCGDCLELMKQLPDGCVDAVVSDPPYGTGWVRGGGRNAGEFHAKHERPDWDVFSVDWIRLSLTDQWAVFCPKNRCREVWGTLPNSGIVHYRKTNPRPGGNPLEAVIVKPGPWLWDRLEYAAYNGDCPDHPCQKPVEVMEWLVGEMRGDTILDPFCGSGTTLVAAKKLGRHYLGFEISPEYCDIARKRLDAIDRQPTLFEPKPEQLSLGGSE